MQTIEAKNGYTLKYGATNRGDKYYFVFSPSNKAFAYANSYYENAKKYFDKVSAQGKQNDSEHVPSSRQQNKFCEGSIHNQQQNLERADGINDL